MQTADLGVIVACIELGVLDLMDAGHHVPTDDQLAEAAKVWASKDNKTFDERDLHIVLSGMGLGNKLRKEGAKYAPAYASVPNLCIK